jgi:predicted component of type VI protein secretion system
VEQERADMAIEGRLEVILGAEAGQVVPLGATPVTFGRAPGNVVVVKDAAVSRQHAKIFERDGRHFVADLNSSHGTIVNGAKVTLQELKAGDEVKLGATLYRYGDGPKAEPTIAPMAAAPAPAKPLPPVNTTYRRALTETGEDPFAQDSFTLEEPTTGAPSVSAAPKHATAPVPAPVPAPAPELPDVAPQIEFRGRTAEQFAARGGAPAAPAAAGRSAGAHVPPPLANVARRRGPFSFFKDELDQRGPFARAVALLFALAAAGGLLWLTLQLTAGVAKVRPADDTAPTGPERPSLPPRH